MSLITDEMRAQVGHKTRSYSMKVEAGDLLRYAKAVGADQPWHADERAARHSRFGGIVAAPTYLITMRGLGNEALAAAGLTVSLPNGVDGGSRWEYLEPIRPGDVIYAVAHIAGYEERETRLGTSLFQVIDITYRNQFGDVVVRQRDTRIYYPESRA